MASHSQRGTVAIESTEVPYLDLRAEPAEMTRQKLDQFIEEIARAPAPGTSGIRGLAITVTQPSDKLALSLAAFGIMLIDGDLADPLPMLMDRLRNQLAVIRSAGFTSQPQVTPSADVSAPVRGPRSESAYAQRPGIR